MKADQHEKWEPIEGVTTPAACALIVEDHDGLTITLVFSELVDGLDADLRIKFGRVPAYAVYEEFVHPWIESGGPPIPKLEGKWKDFSYPILFVRNSTWQSSFSDFQLINWPEPVHYRLVTLDQTVDVLCNRSPEVMWVRAADLALDKATQECTERD